MTETNNAIATSDNKGDNEKGQEKEKEEFTLYPNRWLILFIFCLTSMTNSFQVRLTVDMVQKQTDLESLGLYFSEPCLLDRVTDRVGSTWLRKFSQINE